MNVHAYNFMKFKSIFLSVFAVLALTMSLQAQTAKNDTVKAKKSSPAYRIQIGYGQLFRSGDYLVTSPYNSIKAGMTVEFPIKKGFGVESGLIYSYDFGKRNQLYAHYDTAFFNYHGHFLDVPVRLTYSFPTFWGIKIFLYGGLNVNIGLAQTENRTFDAKSTDTTPTNALDYPVTGKYNLYNSDLNRFNLQLGTGGGVQWKKYRIRSGYDWGLNNVSKSSTYPQKIKGWNIAFEYEF